MSKLADKLARQIRDANIPAPIREYRFARPLRDWRADFAWPAMRVLVEVEGGVWIQGGHVRGAMFNDNCDKYNTAALMGFKLLRFTTNHITKGLAVPMIAQALGLAHQGNLRKVIPRKSAA